MRDRQDHRKGSRRPGGAIGLAFELGKGGLTVFVVGTTWVGYLLASVGSLQAGRLLMTLVGTSLVSGGTLALNQWMEVEADGRMIRTRGRPIPSGRISPTRALSAAIVTVGSGLVLLALGVNLLTAGLALVVSFLYLLVYTPLKQRSALCTLIGAVCGAIPPIMGWTAATGRFEAGTWILAGILFLWQVPHFLALAWLYRDDYARGRFRVLPVLDQTGRWTGRMVLLYTLALLPLGLMATMIGMAGVVFLIGSIVLGLAFFSLGLRLHLRRNETSARALFVASLVYLPSLLGLMVANR